MLRIDTSSIFCVSIGLRYCDSGLMKKVEIMNISENLNIISEISELIQLESEITTQQQEKAFNQYEGNPVNFWSWYSLWCYENSYFNNAK